MSLQTGKIMPFTLRHLLRKPATIAYPANRENLGLDGLRGALAYDADKCIGCNACMRDCPSNAIQIEKVADKQYKATYHLDRCLFCAQCVDVCPKDALVCTPNFELAGFSREAMTYEL